MVERAAWGPLATVLSVASHRSAGNADHRSAAQSAVFVRSLVASSTAGFSPTKPTSRADIPTHTRHPCPTTPNLRARRPRVVRHIGLRRAGRRRARFAARAADWEASELPDGVHTDRGGAGRRRLRSAGHVRPSALHGRVVAGTELTSAVCEVVDLVEKPTGTIVHLVLPGTIAQYRKLVERVGG